MELDDFNKNLWLNIETNEIAFQDEPLKQGVWVEVHCKCTETKEEDVGIGEYEFWGSVYVDNRTETIPTDFDVYVVGYDIVGMDVTDDLERRMENFTVKDLSDEQYDLLVEYAVECY